MKYTLGAKMIVKKSFWHNAKKSYPHNSMKNFLTSGRKHIILLNCNVKMKKDIFPEKVTLFGQR